MESSSAKEIYVVLHGNAWGNQPDPCLTLLGEDQANAAEEKFLLPKDPAEIICGTGRRHLETARLFGIKPTLYSVLVGAPDASDLIDQIGEVVRLADSTTVCPSKRWLTPDTRQFLKDLAHDTILITGIPFMVGLGYNEARPGMIFKISLDTDGQQVYGIEEIQTIFSPYDKGLGATGQPENVMAEASH
jgi:hypothetical protein